MESRSQYCNMNQELFEKHLCNQSSHYEKYRQFPFWKEAIIKLVPFAVSKDKRNTKDDTGKSMKSTVVCQKAPLGLKKTQTTKKTSLWP